MRLCHLTVTNHSRLADLDIRVPEHLVLVGPNDSGKSSVLRILRLLLGASVAQLHAEISASDFRVESEPLVVVTEFERFTDDEKAAFPDEITVNDDGTLTLVVRLEASIDDGGTLELRRWAPDAGHGRQLSRLQITTLGFRLVSSRSADRDIGAPRSTTLIDVLASVDLGEEREAFENAVRVYEAQLSGSVALASLREQLAAQLSQALPRPVAKDELRFVSGAAASQDVLEDVELHLSSSGLTRNVTEQSDGTRALFAAAMYDLVSAAANVVALDEPETHLHPASQRSLARLLRTSGTQKIIATHSTDVAGAFDPEHVVTVKPGGVLVQPKAAVFAGDKRTALRWWMRDKLEPLTARSVVAVEGQSDRIVVERAAELTDRQLDRLGAALVETGGAGDMAVIFKLFGPDGFNVPFALLIDEDAEAETADAMGIELDQLATYHVWVSRIDLEGEYVRALGPEVVWSAVSSSGLFTHNQLALCAPTGLDGKRTEDDLRAFCGRNNTYKVKAAIAVASVLDADAVARITSVDNLLAHVAS